MTWFDYLLIGWLAFGYTMLVASIGKPRKPIEPSVAVVALFINGLLVAGLLWSRGVFS